MHMLGRWTAATLVALVLSVTSAAAKDPDGQTIRLGDQPAIAAAGKDDTTLVWGHGYYRGYYGSYYGNCYGYYGNCYGNCYGGAYYGNGYASSYYGNGYGSSYYGNCYGSSYYGNCYGNCYGSAYYGNCYGGAYYGNGYGNGYGSSYYYGRSYYGNCYGNGYGGAYYGNGYGGRYYGNGYYNSYYRPSYFNGYGGGYYRMALTKEPYGGSVGSFTSAAPNRPVERTGNSDQNMLPPPKDPAFRYDGGPANPVPLPKIDTQPQKSAPIDPTQGRIAALPSQPTRYTYRAYGEKAVPTVLSKEDTVKTARR
jgi:hypothetical protein